MKSKRLLLIELNEFSIDLFQQGILEFKLPNISKVLSMNESQTITDDHTEHRGLDPWVQWVSVHTGVPLTEHGVLHLADAPKKLKHKQLWEKLSALKVSSGIWGAMNATKGDSDTCKFFLPDPWTFGESPYPKSLNDLLALPIYYSKNYLDVSKIKFLKLSLKLIKFVLTSGSLTTIFKLFPLILKGVFHNGLNNAVLFILFDLFSTSLFLEFKRKYNPQFSLIFLNSIAHIQHHSWHKTTPMPKDLRFALESIDRVLGLLLNSIDKDDAVIVLNGLTQRNVTSESPKIMYRQINPVNFLNSAGLSFDRVEQLMTFDAHVFFKSREMRDFSAQALKSVTIDNKPLFQVECDSENPLQLFYQIDIWDPVNPNTVIIINNKRIKFFDQFQAVIVRTGSHVPYGNLFSNKIDFPKKIYNHEVAEHILKYLA